LREHGYTIHGEISPSMATMSQTNRIGAFAPAINRHGVRTMSDRTPYAIVKTAGESVRVECHDAFSVKDVLKKRGYSYDNRVWSKEMQERHIQIEAIWLARRGIPLVEG
jgi:hypothetical protein